MGQLLTITIIVMLVALRFPGHSHAGDFSHVCRTIGDLYEIDDGTLSSKTDAAQKPIPYAKVQETVLSQKRGYCLAGGRRHLFEAKTYVLRIRFLENGRSIELDALCELSADGLPASLSCEREVVTHAFNAGGVGSRPPGSSGNTIWNHNGSLMRLEANGSERRFVYDLPRRGMLEAGVKSGDIVFDGRREGPTYSGTAYIYTKLCGRVAYPVAGNVSANERTVALEGQVPLHAPNCTVRSYRRDKLQFDLVDR